MKHQSTYERPVRSSVRKRQESPVDGCNLFALERNGRGPEYDDAGGHHHQNEDEASRDPIRVAAGDMDHPASNGEQGRKHERTSRGYLQHLTSIPSRRMLQCNAIVEQMLCGAVVAVRQTLEMPPDREGSMTCSLIIDRFLSATSVRWPFSRCHHLFDTIDCASQQPKCLMRSSKMSNGFFTNCYSSGGISLLNKCAKDNTTDARPCSYAGRFIKIENGSVKGSLNRQVFKSVCHVHTGCCLAFAHYTIPVVTNSILRNTGFVFFCQLSRITPAYLQGAA